MTLRRELADLSAYGMLVIGGVATVLLVVSFVAGLCVAVTTRRHDIQCSIFDGTPRVYWYMKPNTSTDTSKVDFYTWPRDDAPFPPAHWPGIGNIGSVPPYAKLITLPWWLVVMGAFAYPVAWWFAIRRMPRAGQCKNCGYDLRGTRNAGRTDCPECGEAIADPAHEPVAASVSTAADQEKSNRSRD